MLRTIHRLFGPAVLTFAVLALSACSDSKRDAAPKAASSAAKTAPVSEPVNVGAKNEDSIPPFPGTEKSDDSSKAMGDRQGRPNSNEDVVAERRPPKERPKLPPPADAQRLSPDFDVWIDLKRGVLIVDGEISLREGMLEMFACTRNTKEHESIISANTRASLVHTGLLALGAEVGHPVQFMPEFKPPAGTEIDITIEWSDAAGKQQSVRAQELIKDIRTEKAMTHPFVFAGSLFYKDPESGQQYYMAESGDFICVSNFATAMLDIPVESSQSNESLEFVAFTERIPPLGTPVRMILKPILKKEGEKAGEKTAKAKEQ